MPMRYFIEKPEITTHMFGRTYECDHPLYNRCTLYQIGNKGIAIVQQRFDADTKSTYWTEIDPWLNDILYLSPAFAYVGNSMTKANEIEDEWIAVTAKDIASQYNRLFDL